MLRRPLGLFLLFVALVPALRAETRKPKKSETAQKSLQLKDVLAWKSLRGAVLSNDGKWLAYRLAPLEGNAEIVLRATKGRKELRFAVGDARRSSSLVFSHDSQWLAFRSSPPAKKGRPASRSTRSTGKLVLLKIATGKKTEFENVRRFAFSGESSRWVALHQSAGGGPTGTSSAGRSSAQPGRRSSSSSSTAAAAKASGTDLILRNLAGGNEMNIGNVSEFAFDKKGTRLAVVIDAARQSGNGVQLRNLASGVQISLDSGKARYRGLGWTSAGDAFAVLKGIDDKQFEDKLYSVLGFSHFGPRAPRKTVYDPHKDKGFPTGMTISPNRTPSWTENLDALVFGIHKTKKKGTKKKAATKKTTGGKKSVKANNSRTSNGEPGLAFQVPRGRKSASSSSGATQKPDLVIWHWKDPRLQSMQQVQASRDKNSSDLCLYRVKEKKFIRLADDKLRTVTLAPKQRWAVGYDERGYRLAGNLDGRRYRDVFVVDTKTGKRRRVLRKHRWGFLPCPQGKHALYYSDGQYYTCELATGKTFNITRDVPTSFVDKEDDHNVALRPIRPFGWVKGSGAVLLYDNWDVWKVPVHGGKGVNLTADGRKQGVRYRQRIVLDREKEKDGIDVAGRIYFSVYGEWTKKSGFACLEAGGKLKRLLWETAAFSTLIKAKHRPVYLYTRQTFQQPPDYYVSGPSLAGGQKLTDVNAGQKNFRWSPGCRLVDYTSAKGKKLQAALFLPAGYEPHQRYPTIVYIYERLSNRLHRYNTPSARGFSPSVYTSNGYAVLMPDISYTINDPGRSACWCVLPALEAAIGTGVVDRDRVGLHGHSWGGYQTSFLITQTNAFKAAVAGAPLTNLVSMYSSIYWNSGSANQPIFESSQGRFTHGYWDDIEAYTRNSPVYFAKKVATPLLLLHNDRDGAVDWNQGIEFFNTLRRLGKPVVMLQYKGENHGLVKPANRKDYTVRMSEFFDHHLRGKPAPKWLREGVTHLRHDEHLKQRAKEINGK